jgi:hypothetical protein
MRNRLIFISSDEPDHGRGMLARLLIEYSLLHGEQPVVVEPHWDGLTLLPRYQGEVFAIPMLLEPVNEVVSGLQRLFERLEQPDDPPVIIRLPGDDLEEVQGSLYDLIEPRIDDLELETVMAFVLGPSIESEDTLEISWGMGIGQVADDMIAVPNAFYGPIKQFYWRTESEFRKYGWIDAGYGEHTLPRLAPTLDRRIQSLPGRLFDLALGKSPGLTPRQQRGLLRWLHLGEELALRVLYGHPVREGDLDGAEEGDAGDLTNKAPVPSTTAAPISALWLPDDR